MFAPIAFSRTQSFTDSPLRSRVARGIAASTAFALTLGMVALAGPAAVADEEVPQPIAPVAVDDAVTVTKNTQTWITVTDNDSDADSLFYLTEVSQPAGGQIFAVENTRFLYKSKPGFVGVDTVSYRLKDVSGLYSEWATVSITVPNAAPVAVDDDRMGAKNVMSTGNVTDNDSDADGDALTVTWGTPSRAGFTGIGSGYWQWVLGTFEGVVTVPYTLHDGYGGTDEGVLTVSVPIYGTDAPVVVDDHFTMVQDTTLSVAAPGVLVNDHDPDGSPFHAMIMPGSADHGTLVGAADGSFTYTPDAGFVGTETLIYQAIDVDLHKSPAAEVTIEVLPAVVPTAAADTYWTPQDKLLLVNGTGVLANDMDAVSATKVSNPAHGNLSFGSDGKFTYQPDSGFVGTDSFEYRAVNGTGDSTPVTVTIEIGGTKPVWFTPPVANADTATTTKNQDVVINLVQNDDIPAGGGATIVLADAGASNGQVVAVDQANGTVTYRPDSGYAGADQFFYAIYDMNGLQSGWAGVTLTVEDDSNQAPVVTDLSLTRVKGSLALSAGNAYDLVTDPEGNDVTITWDVTPSVGVFFANIGAFGAWQWTPPSDYVGVQQIQFTATDALGASTQGTITIAVIEDPLAPVSADDTYDTTVGTPLVVEAANGLYANDTDPDSQWQDMMVDLNTSGLDGTVTVAWDGSFQFNPTPGFNGVTAFYYRLLDDTGRYGNIAKVTIYVGVAAAQNAAPVATADEYSVDQNGQLAVASAQGLLANDTDVDADALTVSTNTTPAHGTVTVAADGSFEYAPAAGFVGIDTFEYSLTDGTAITTATVTITVLEVQGGSSGGGEDTPAPVDEPEATTADGTKGETKAHEAEADAVAQVDESKASEPTRDVGEDTPEQAGDPEPARDEDAIEQTDAAAPGSNAAAQADTASNSMAGLLWLALVSATAFAGVAIWIARRLRARSNAA